MIKRASIRLICSKCATIYLPADGSAYANKICSKCGGELIQRPDDKPDVIRVRIKEYESRMKDLLDYYSKKGRLIMIDGEGTILEVTAEIFKKIDENIKVK